MKPIMIFYYGLYFIFYFTFLKSSVEMKKEKFERLSPKPHHLPYKLLHCPKMKSKMILLLWIVFLKILKSRAPN